MVWGQITPPWCRDREHLHGRGTEMWTSAAAVETDWLVWRRQGSPSGSVAVRTQGQSSDLYIFLDGPPPLSSVSLPPRCPPWREGEGGGGGRWHAGRSVSTTLLFSLPTSPGAKTKRASQAHSCVNFSTAACEIIWTDPSLRYTSMVLGR